MSNRVSCKNRKISAKAVYDLLKHSLVGAEKTVAGHIERAERVAHALKARFGVSNPRAYQAKHLRWFLVEWCAPVKGIAVATRYDYWRTLRVIAAALGKFEDWEPHLRGDWARRGCGGRKPKLPGKR